MKVRDDGAVLLVRFEPGEEIVSGLKEACRRHGVKGGMISGIGALSRAKVLVAASARRLKPEFEEIAGPIEIGAATGNVSLKEGEVLVHLHACLGLMKDSEAGSSGPTGSWNTHLAEGVVSLTGLFFILKTKEIASRFHEATGMWVWDIGQASGTGQ